MIQLTRQFLIKFSYIMMDIICMVVSIYIACLIRQDTVPFAINLENLFFSLENQFRFLFIFWIVVTLIQNNTHRLYETKREIYETVELWGVFRSVVTASLIVIVTIFLLKFQDFPRTIMLLTSGFAICLLSVWRFFKRLFVEYLIINGYNNFNAVIIGAGKVGRTLNEEIQNKRTLGIKVSGFLDDFKTNDSWEHKQPILGKIDDLPNIIRREFINKVFITIHHDSAVFMKILEQAKESGVAVRVVPQGFNIISSEYYKYNIGFIPIIEYPNGLGHRKLYGKAIFDFMAVLVGTIVISPLLLAIMIWIKIDDPAGAIFYKSRRFGRRGRMFHMLKFRSMVTDAEKKHKALLEKNEVDGPIFKIKNDPRITKCGQWLRKYSLDELPQIFNVLKGDMSLVGPRPLPIDQIEKKDLKQLKRLEVKPGITGLWQIRGRSDVSFSRLVRWDIWYISNWSFWLDLNILIQTIPIVIKGKGAY